MKLLINDLTTVENKKLDVIEAEQNIRNQRQFKIWARRWYHRYHELPVKQKTYWLS